MNTTEIIERYKVTSLRANFPSVPFAPVADTVRRASLRLSHRWVYAPAAVCVAFLAAGLLLTGVLVNHTGLVLLGTITFALAIILLFRLAPAKLTDQTARAEAEAERTITKFTEACQNQAKEFGGAALDAIRRESERGVRNGETLSAVSEFKNKVISAWSAVQSDCAAALTLMQTASKAAHDELLHKRAQLAAVTQSRKASFIPGPARRAAREVLNSVSKSAEARLREATVKAEISAYQLILTALDSFPSVPIVATPITSCEAPEIPVWLGQMVPSFDNLKATAAALVEANISMIREKLVENSQVQSPADIINDSINNLFKGQPPGPKSVEEHVSNLNGSGKEWAQRMLSEAEPFSPISPDCLRKRHRKCWCITENGASSAVFQNLKDAFSDEAAKFFALEGPRSQMLFFDEERGVTAGEFDEFKPIFAAFRSLPIEEQRLLVTSCEPEDLLNFYPECGRDEHGPIRILACSLVFDVVRRNGAEAYCLGDQIIGKGFDSTLNALKTNQRLAFTVATKMASSMAELGSVVAMARLKESQNKAATYVPKMFKKAFLLGIEDGLSELARAGLSKQQS